MTTDTGPFAYSFDVEGRRVGDGSPTYVIAEIGANHDCDKDRTKQLIDAAADAGADAVKFQTLDYDKQFHDPTTDDDVSELYDRIELPEAWYGELQEYAADAGVTFFTSPTYPGGVELLAEHDVPLYKIASAQVVSDPPLIRRIAAQGKPVILSTGLGGYGHIETALETCLEAGNRDVAVLHCISEYPTDPDAAQLRRVERLHDAFDTVVGFSDHTESTHIPAASVALGADVVEKHITLDRDSEGPDHHYAREPDEFATMVKGIREVEQSLGSGVKLAANEDEAWLRDHVQLKLVTDTPVEAGASLAEDHVTFRRSPEGIPREYLSELTENVRFARNLDSGALITWDRLTINDD